LSNDESAVVEIQKCEFSLSIAVLRYLSQLALHIEIYRASRGFLATAQLLFDLLAASQQQALIGTITL